MVGSTSSKFTMNQGVTLCQRPNSAVWNFCLGAVHHSSRKFQPFSAPLSHFPFPPATPPANSKFLSDMNPHIKCILVCLPFILISCTGPVTPIPITPYVDAIRDGETNPRSIAGRGGQQSGERESQELDNYLASVMKMKREVEVAGRSMKTEYASDPVVQRLGHHKYDLAVAELENLRLQVRRDFVSKASGTSPATLQAADSFQQRGNELIAYHAEISGSERFGSAVVIALELLGELYNAWSGFEEQRQKAVLNGVDQRLGFTPWQSL
jgi:hypothetical protein